MIITPYLAATITKLITALSEVKLLLQINHLISITITYMIYIITILTYLSFTLWTIYILTFYYFNNSLALTFRAKL
jgi:hypothetical protein